MDGLFRPTGTIRKADFRKLEDDGQGGMSKAHSADERQSGSEASQTVLWVQQAQAGDRVAFHRLVDRFQPEIYRMIYYRTRSQMDAEDLTQDVFLKTFKHIGRLKSPKVFRSWLYRIAVNRLKDYYRHKQFKSLFRFISTDEETFQEPEEMTLAPQAADNLDREAFWQQVKMMLAKLSRMEREVFLLRFFDQLTIKEITSALGKSESTIKTQLYRALYKVRNEAADLEELMEGI